MGVWPKGGSEGSLKHEFLIQMIDWQELPCSLGWSIHATYKQGHRWLKITNKAVVRIHEWHGYQQAET